MNTIEQRLEALEERNKTGYADGSYSVIAGHLDGGETASVAMAREAAEEAGITVALEDLKVVHTMHRSSKNDTGASMERVDFFFTADAWEGEPIIAEPEKCDDLQWFSLDDLPENMVSYVRSGIEQYRKGSQFSEFGW